MIDRLSPASLKVIAIRRAVKLCLSDVSTHAFYGFSGAPDRVNPPPPAPRVAAVVFAVFLCTATAKKHYNNT